MVSSVGDVDNFSLYVSRAFATSPYGILVTDNADFFKRSKIVFGESSLPARIEGDDI
jgi:dTDP-4-amino-4,6-dideoxygalactose transaminase